MDFPSVADLVSLVANYSTPEAQLAGAAAGGALIHNLVARIRRRPKKGAVLSRYDASVPWNFHPHGSELGKPPPPTAHDPFGPVPPKV